MESIPAFQKGADMNQIRNGKFWLVGARLFLIWLSLSLLSGPNSSSAQAAEEKSSSSRSSSLVLPPAGYQLVFDDEFNGTSVNTTTWNLEGVWGGPVSSTNPNFSYTTSNVTEGNGVLTITALKSGGNWTGGIISTTNINSPFTFQYGFVECRAQLPPGQGFWPAIWCIGSPTADGLLPNAPDVDNEFDIMEFLGGNVTDVYQTYHWEKSLAVASEQEQTVVHNANWTSEFHIFQMLWQPGRITFYIDGVETASSTKSVPSNPMYLIINFDVGGVNDWGGAPNSTTPSPAYLNVDYIRVYQQ
jgi:beta-glucanase (GH16 family)